MSFLKEVTQTVSTPCEHAYKIDLGKEEFLPHRDLSNMLIDIEQIWHSPLLSQRLQRKTLSELFFTLNLESPRSRPLNQQRIY
jgi:hypothetical protein